MRPSIPKDSPSNLAWLPEKATEHADAVALTIELPAGDPEPKLCVVIQGKGNRDALSGWSLPLDLDGDGVRGYLARYDLRYYASDRVQFDKASKKPVALELAWFARRLTVKLGALALFDQVPLRAIQRNYCVGPATWDQRCASRRSNCAGRCAHGEVGVRQSDSQRTRSEPRAVALMASTKLHAAPMVAP